MMRSRYRYFPMPLRKPEKLLIFLSPIVGRYSETYGPTDLEYCLLAALLVPNCSSLVIERMGWALAPRAYSFAAVLVEQGSISLTLDGPEKLKRGPMGPFLCTGWH